MVSSKRTVFSSVKLFALIVMLALISPLVHAQAIIYDRSFADMSANLDAAFRNIPDPTGEINIRLQQIHSVADFTPVDVGALNFLLGTLRAGNIDSTATAALDQFTTRINEALANPTATIPPNPNGPATQPPAPAPSPSGGATAAPSTGGSTDTPTPGASTGASPDATATAGPTDNASTTAGATAGASGSTTLSGTRAATGSVIATTARTLTPVTAPFAPNTQSGADQIVGSAVAAAIAVVMAAFVL